jgi:hypothetical protein
MHSFMGPEVLRTREGFLAKITDMTLRSSSFCPAIEIILLFEISFQIQRLDQPTVLSSPCGPHPDTAPCVARPRPTKSRDTLNTPQPTKQCSTRRTLFGSNKKRTLLSHTAPFFAKLHPARPRCSLLCLVTRCALLSQSATYILSQAAP